MELVFSHQLDQESALNYVSGLLTGLKRRHERLGNMQDVRIVWNGLGCEISFTCQGYNVTTWLMVGPREVRLVGQLPTQLHSLKNRIEFVIRTMARAMLAAYVTEPDGPKL